MGENTLLKQELFISKSLKANFIENIHSTMSKDTTEQ